jgi:hypothetical protein
MSNNKVTAFHKCHYAHLKTTFFINELMFAAIAEEFELDEKKVAEVAYEAVNKVKLPTMKPVTRVPKIGETGPKKGRKKTGYTLWQSENRQRIIDLLINDEDERTFKSSRNGEEMTIDEDSFKNDKPTFIQVGQKCSSIWKYDVTQEEKEEYSERAKKEDTPVKPTSKAKSNGKGKKGKSSKSKASQTEDEDEEDDETEAEDTEAEDTEAEETEEEEKSVKKKGSQKTVPKKSGKQAPTKRKSVSRKSTK